MIHVSAVRFVFLLAIAALFATSCESDQPEASDQSGELGADAADCFALADQLVAFIEENSSCTVNADCSHMIAWGLICLRPEVETPADCSRSVAINSSSDFQEYDRREVEIQHCIDPSGNWVGRVFDGRACVTGCALVPDVACVDGQCRIVVDEGTIDGGN